MSNRTTSIDTKSTFSSTKEKLLKHQYILASNTPLKNTAIYETVGPYGSHVFVNTSPVSDDNKPVKKVPQNKDLVEVIELADGCCEYLTGYVIIHPSGIVVKTAQGARQNIQSEGNEILRIVPLLSIEEIEADGESAALNADKASTHIFSHMIVQVCDEMEKYDADHIEAMEAARDYFRKQNNVLDNVTVEARNTRTEMILNEGSKHSNVLSKNILTLEQLHHHSIKIKERREHVKKTTETFRHMHNELNNLK